MITHPKARIQIKRHTDGEDEEDEEQGGMQSEGTARLLKRFRSYIKVSSSAGAAIFHELTTLVSPILSCFLAIWRLRNHSN